MLDDVDLRLLRRFVDEQISPFRKTGIALMCMAPLGFLAGYLEWNDRGLSEPAPDTTLIAGAIGLALLVTGAIVWWRHRSPEITWSYRVLVTERAQVSRVEVLRVVNSSYDRIVVHSPLAKEPVRLLVSPKDRDAVAALLARAYPSAARAGGTAQARQ